MPYEMLWDPFRPRMMVQMAAGTERDEVVRLIRKLGIFRLGEDVVVGDRSPVTDRADSP